MIGLYESRGRCYVSSPLMIDNMPLAQHRRVLEKDPAGNRVRSQHSNVDYSWSRYIQKVPSSNLTCRFIIIDFVMSRI